MEKVFIIHGFHGWPNGGWRVWLMGELEKKEIYSCALSMPDPDEPICSKWVEEISRAVSLNKKDKIYLVGHSLGSTAILRYLESTDSKVEGVVLVSGPIENVDKDKTIYNFLDKPFDFKRIKSKAKKFLIIHGDNDSRVSYEEGVRLSKELNCNLVTVKGGGHLTGSEGWNKLPQVLDGLLKMINQK